MTPTEVVQSFLRALEALNVDEAMTYVSDAIVYENVGLPPARGRAAFEKQMRMLETSFDRFEVRMHAIAENGGTVLTERTDVLEFYGLRLEPWVCGTFEVQGGKITSWRDYFDWASLTRSVLLGAPGMLLHLAKRPMRASR